MRSALVTVASLLAPLLIAGCTFDVPAGDTADVELSWHLTHRGVDASCNALGAEQVRVDFAPGEPGPRFVDWFPCESMSGTARFLPEGDYMISLTVIGATGQNLEQSTIYPVAVQAPWSASPRIDVDVSTDAVVLQR